MESICDKAPSPDGLGLGPGLRLHTLYLSSRDGSPFSRADRSAVVDAVSARFPGFTMTDTLGYFRGRALTTLAIDIASNDTARVAALARDLCAALGQDAVGLAVGGMFHQVAA